MWFKASSETMQEKLIQSYNISEAIQKELIPS